MGGRWVGSVLRDRSEKGKEYGCDQAEECESLASRQEFPGRRFRPGNNGVRDSCGRVGGYRHFGHRRFSSEVARALDRHCGWHQWPVGERGQGTVEFVLMLGSVLVLVVGLASLWRMAGDGVLLAHAVSSASHNLQLSHPGVIADVFAY